MKKNKTPETYLAQERNKLQKKKELYDFEARKRALLELNEKNKFIKNKSTKVLRPNFLINKQQKMKKKQKSKDEIYFSSKYRNKGNKLKSSIERNYGKNKVSNKSNNQNLLNNALPISPMSTNPNEERIINSFDNISKKIRKFIQISPNFSKKNKKKINMILNELEDENESNRLINRNNNLIDGIPFTELENNDKNKIKYYSQMIESSIQEKDKDKYNYGFCKTESRKMKDRSPEITEREQNDLYKSECILHKDIIYDDYYDLSPNYKILCKNTNNTTSMNDLKRKKLPETGQNKVPVHCKSQIIPDNSYLLECEGPLISKKIRKQYLDTMKFFNSFKQLIIDPDIRKMKTKKENKKEIKNENKNEIKKESKKENIKENKKEKENKENIEDYNNYAENIKNHQIKEKEKEKEQIKKEENKNIPKNDESQKKMKSNKEITIDDEVINSKKGNKEFGLGEIYGEGEEDNIKSDDNNPLNKIEVLGNEIISFGNNNKDAIPSSYEEITLGNSNNVNMFINKREDIPQNIKSENNFTNKEVKNEDSPYKNKGKKYKDFENENEKEDLGDNLDENLGDNLDENVDEIDDEDEDENEDINIYEIEDGNKFINKNKLSTLDEDKDNENKNEGFVEDEIYQFDNIKTVDKNKNNNLIKNNFQDGGGINILREKLENIRNNDEISYNNLSGIQANYTKVYSIFNDNNNKNSNFLSQDKDPQTNSDLTKYKTFNEIKANYFPFHNDSCSLKSFDNNKIKKNISANLSFEDKPITNKKKVSVSVTNTVYRKPKHNNSDKTSFSNKANNKHEIASKYKKMEINTRYEDNKEIGGSNTNINEANLNECRNITNKGDDYSESNNNNYSMPKCSNIDECILMFDNVSKKEKEKDNKNIKKNINQNIIENEKENYNSNENENDAINKADNESKNYHNIQNNKQNDKKNKLKLNEPKISSEGNDIKPKGENDLYNEENLELLRGGFSTSSFYQIMNENSIDKGNKNESEKLLENAGSEKSCNINKENNEIKCSIPKENIPDGNAPNEQIISVSPIFKKNTNLEAKLGVQRYKKKKAIMSNEIIRTAKTNIPPKINSELNLNDNKIVGKTDKKNQFLYEKKKKKTLKREKSYPNDNNNDTSQKLSKVDVMQLLENNDNNSQNDSFNKNNNINDVSVEAPSGHVLISVVNENFSCSPNKLNNPIKNKVISEYSFYYKFYDITRKIPKLDKRYFVTKLFAKEKIESGSSSTHKIPKTQPLYISKNIYIEKAINTDKNDNNNLQRITVRSKIYDSGDDQKTDKTNNIIAFQQAALTRNSINNFSIGEGSMKKKFLVINKFNYSIDTKSEIDKFSVGEASNFYFPSQNNNIIVGRENNNDSEPENKAENLSDKKNKSDEAKIIQKELRKKMEIQKGNSDYVQQVNEKTYIYPINLSNVYFKKVNKTSKIKNTNDNNDINDDNNNKNINVLNVNIKKIKRNKATINSDEQQSTKNTAKSNNRYRNMVDSNKHFSEIEKEELQLEQEQLMKIRERKKLKKKEKLIRSNPILKPRNKSSTCIRGKKITNIRNRNKEDSILNSKLAISNSKEYKINTVVRVIQNMKASSFRLTQEKNIHLGKNFDRKSNEEKLALIILELDKMKRELTGKDLERENKIIIIIKEDLENYIMFSLKNTKCNNIIKIRKMIGYNWSIIEQLIIRVKIDLADLLNLYLKVCVKIVDTKEKILIANEYIENIIDYYKDNYFNQRMYNRIRPKILAILFQYKSSNNEKRIENRYIFEIMGNLFYILLMNELFFTRDLNIFLLCDEEIHINIAKIVRYIIIHSERIGDNINYYEIFQHNRLFYNNPIYFKFVTKFTRDTLTILNYQPKYELIK